MTLLLQLPPELEIRLSAAAASEGVEVAEYVVQLLRTRLSTAATTSVGDEVVAAWAQDGVLGAWADRVDIGDTDESARSLRRQAEARSRS